MRECGDVGPSRRRHKVSGGRAPSAGRFLRFFIKNDVILGIFELKLLLQNIFDDNRTLKRIVIMCLKSFVWQ